MKLGARMELGERGYFGWETMRAQTREVIEEWKRGKRTENITIIRLSGFCGWLDVGVRKKGKCKNKNESHNTLEMCLKKSLFCVTLIIFGVR